jgi:hypothetical protein
MVLEKTVVDDVILVDYSSQDRSVEIALGLGLPAMNAICAGGTGSRLVALRMWPKVAEVDYGVRAWT